MDSSTPGAVFLDLAKAFDTVDHETLFKKLYAVGIRGLPLITLKNYLTNEQQYVKINGIRSEMLSIEIGVPQGTILGPLLFIIYINDIFDIVDSQSYIFSYADDTSLICYDVSWSLVAKRLQNLLCKVKLWLQNNVLLLESMQIASLYHLEWF